MSDRLKIINGKIITPAGITEGSLNIENGKIVGINTRFDSDAVIDAQGKYISPGFVDIHTHGGGGCDFMDGTVKAFLTAGEVHAKHGTTTLLPTLLSAGFDETVDAIKTFEKARKTVYDGANLIGLHIEGPYFAVEQCGAQDTRFTKSPDKNEYKKLLSLSKNIHRWSAAPELDGALEFGKTLDSKGVLPSIGHSNATYEQVLEAFDCGYTHITHLYSAMSTVHRIKAMRFAGIVESAYLIDDMSVEIIADGVHLPQSLLQFVTKFKKPEKVALVTDSMRAAGMGEGESTLGSLENGQRVIVEDGVAKLLDRSAFAGSVATMDRLVRNIVTLTDTSICDAVRMASTTPAEIMGYNSKGKIECGADADILIFDDNINIKCTIIDGRLIYKGE
ncbi:MAG TPA: N-acetylglucosamine-6-phosphate deacetylase [Clostridia bacterium]|nr:N-acetylglucosamine-6-phosphate deacetylase [Clostridia bacterium]